MLYYNGINEFLNLRIKILSFKFSSLFSDYLWMFSHYIKYDNLNFTCFRSPQGLIISIFESLNSKVDPSCLLTWKMALTRLMLAIIIGLVLLDQLSFFGLMQEQARRKFYARSNRKFNCCCIHLVFFCISVILG